MCTLRDGDFRSERVIAESGRGGNAGPNSYQEFGPVSAPETGWNTWRWGGSEIRVGFRAGIRFEFRFRLYRTVCYQGSVAG